MVDIPNICEIEQRLQRESPCGSELLVVTGKELRASPRQRATDQTGDNAGNEASERHPSAAYAMAPMIATTITSQPIPDARFSPAEPGVDLDVSL
jgi:hypothetical protein